MYRVRYDIQAKLDLKKLEKHTAKRIFKKIQFYSEQQDPLQFASKLSGFGQNKHRFRVGEYRVIFSIDKDIEINILMILRIKHRKDIYRLN